MKLRLLVVAACLMAVATSVRAGVNFSVGISISNVQDFHAPLAPYGYWTEVGTYGRCWRPAYIGTQWRPYTNGHWEWTEQGWFWVSDEPWAWATYHYGRWVCDPYYGWVWVPGVEWAPAWVAWRHGGGHIGWAPLPPHCEYGPGGVLLVERIRWHPHAFVFVEHRHFCGPIRPTVIVRNQTIINQTTYVTNIHRGDRDHDVHRNGPPVERVQEFSSRRIERVPAADLWRDRSDRVAQRASQEHVAAPRIIGETRTSPTGGHAGPPSRVSKPTGEETRRPSPSVERERPTVTTPTPSRPSSQPSSGPSVQRVPEPHTPKVRTPESRGPTNANRGHFFGGQVLPPARSPSVTREEGERRTGRPESPGGRPSEYRGEGRRSEPIPGGGADDWRRGPSGSRGHSR
jgi:hypothetical protein